VKFPPEGEDLGLCGHTRKGDQHPLHAQSAAVAHQREEGLDMNVHEEGEKKDTFSDNVERKSESEPHRPEATIL
jgi:hypothetical protein